jgi:NAD(P)-dependent dehydrogenase (short-subunit alcohol dehydrogenase family)
VSADAAADLLAHPPELRLDGRVAWITGASRGLGRAIAFAFAGSGADLVLSARSREPLEEIASLVHAQGGTVTVAPGSVDSPADVARTIEGIGEAHGRLDVLVNNAGISPHFVRAEQLRPEALREVLETNLFGAFACTRAAHPLLAAAPAASVVNVSSIHGRLAGERLLAYAASKGALEMMTRTLAIEWAAGGIRVNSLAPGYIETEMTEALRDHPRRSAELLDRTPMGRFAGPAEIAACALFLAGPASSYVTGATLLADGGWSAR